MGIILLLIKSQPPKFDTRSISGTVSLGEPGHGHNQPSLGSPLAFPQHWVCGT